MNTSKNTNVQKEISYEKFIKKLEFNFFGLISTTISVSGIIGGISASFILSNQFSIWELGICVSLTMVNITAGICQAPTKWIVYLFVLSTIVNVFLALINF